MSYDEKLDAVYNFIQKATPKMPKPQQDALQKLQQQFNDAVSQITAQMQQMKMSVGEMDEALKVVAASLRPKMEVAGYKIEMAMAYDDGTPRVVAVPEQYDASGEPPKRRHYNGAMFAQDVVAHSLSYKAAGVQMYLHIMADRARHKTNAESLESTIHATYSSLRRQLINELDNALLREKLHEEYLADAQHARNAMADLDTAITTAIGMIRQGTAVGLDAPQLGRSPADPWLRVLDLSKGEVQESRSQYVLSDLRREFWRRFLDHHGVDHCFRVDFDDEGGWVHCYATQRVPGALGGKAIKLRDGEPVLRPPRWVRWLGPHPDKRQEPPPLTPRQIRDAARRGLAGIDW